MRVWHAWFNTKEKNDTQIDSSDYPVHVRRVVVKNVFDSVRKITTTHGELDRETDYLCQIFSNNRDPLPLICLAWMSYLGEDKELEENRENKSSLVLLLYVAGLIEDIRCECGKFNVRFIFKSSITLRSQLNSIMDKLPSNMNVSVVNRIPCSCG